MHMAGINVCFVTILFSTIPGECVLQVCKPGFFDITCNVLCPQKCALNPNTGNAMVTNYLRTPYGVYFTKTIVRWYCTRMAPGRRQEESYDTNFQTSYGAW